MNDDDICTLVYVCIGLVAGTFLSLVVYLCMCCCGCCLCATPHFKEGAGQVLIEDVGHVMEENIGHVTNEKQKLVEEDEIVVSVDQTCNT